MDPSKLTDPTIVYSENIRQFDEDIYNDFVKNSQICLFKGLVDKLGISQELFSAESIRTKHGDDHIDII